MRIYKYFDEALSEIRRELAEMAILIHPETYQDKYVGDNPDFETLELQDYIYTVTRPSVEDLNPTQPWADAEFDERLGHKDLNPGEAWKLRSEVWSKFIQENGKFGYTYSNRLSENHKIKRVIDRIKKDSDSRQLFISVWDSDDIKKLGGVSRIPCTIGYQIKVREGLLHLTYIQRSADFATHFENDIYLAFKLQKYIAEKTGYEVGRYTHFISSLHVFSKDVDEVF